MFCKKSSWLSVKYKCGQIGRVVLKTICTRGFEQGWRARLSCSGLIICSQSVPNCAWLPRDMKSKEADWGKNVLFPHIFYKNCVNSHQAVARTKKERKNWSTAYGCNRFGIFCVVFELWRMERCIGLPVWLALHWLTHMASSIFMLKSCYPSHFKRRNCRQHSSYWSAAAMTRTVACCCFDCSAENTDMLPSVLLSFMFEFDRFLDSPRSCSKFLCLAFVF